jgi:hypothetical protein
MAPRRWRIFQIADVHLKMSGKSAGSAFLGVEGLFFQQ